MPRNFTAHAYLLAASQAKERHGPVFIKRFKVDWLRIQVITTSIRLTEFE